MSEDIKIKPERLRRPKHYVQFTPELADTICEYIAQGMTLREACRQPDMPSEAAVRQWVLDDAGGISSQYARARALLLEHWADQIIEIADDGSDDVIVTSDGKASGNRDSVNRARLRIDTRKWLLSKLKPERYGERLDLNQNTTFKTVTDKPLTKEEETARWMAQFGNGPQARED